MLNFSNNEDSMMSFIMEENQPINILRSSFVHVSHKRLINSRVFMISFSKNTEYIYEINLSKRLNKILILCTV